MTNYPNPLEPWHPSAGQPLRAQPLRYPPRGEVVDVGPPRPNPPPGPRGDQLLVGVLWLNLLALSVLAYKLLPDNLLPQIVSAAVLVALGLAAGISLARNRSWVLRLFLVLAGLGAAAAAAWFVPTTGGMSLFVARREADRLTAEMAALSPGDSARFPELEAARQRLAAEFPDYCPPVDELFERWRERSEAKWEADLQHLGLGDLAGLEDLRQAYQDLFTPRLEKAELAWFERTYHDLAPGDFAGELKLRALARPDDNWQTSLWTWEDEWADRTVQAVRQQTEPLLARDPLKASRRLRKTAYHLADIGRHDEARNQLLTARARAFQTALEGARREAYAQVVKEQFQAAEYTARDLQSRWQDEAKDVGQADELARFCEGYQFLAEMAQRAKKKDPP